MKPGLSIIAYIYISAIKIKDDCSRYRIYRFRHRPDSRTPHVTRRRLVPSILWLALPLLISAQTSIVAVRSDSEIVVGADSLDRWGNKQAPKSGCKIMRFGDHFFAFAGISLKDGFDIPRMVESAFRSSTTIKGAADVFTGKAEPVLPSVLKRIEHDFPDAFREMKERTEIVSVIFFGFEGGVAHLHDREFVSLDKMTTARLVSYDYETSGLPNLLMLGANDFIVKFTDMNPDYWTTVKLTEATRYLVAMEVVDQPRFVGPPVDVLRVTKDGACWVEPKTPKDCDKDTNIDTCPSPKPAPTEPKKRQPTLHPRKR